MIYLIKSAAYTEDGTGYTDLLKIGYTGEKSKKSRFSIYLTENPTIQVLYQIKDGDTENERDLHYHFKHLRTKYGREWFKYDQEILNFFETHKTKESLLEIRDIPILSRTQREKVRDNRKNNKNLQNLVNLSVNIIVSGNNLDKEYIKRVKEYLWYKIDTFWELLDNEFPNYKDEIKKKYEELRMAEEERRIENIRLQEAYEYFVQEFDKDNNFERRMKLLCDIYFQYPTFFQSYSNSPIQALIPMSYQNYINILGFERIKTLKYYESAILGYIQSQQNLQNSSITSLFNVGDKYTTKQIKEILSNFYSLNSITKTPKASDLNEYYILKSIKLKVGDKWENGFEIIKQK